MVRLIALRPDQISLDDRAEWNYIRSALETTSVGFGDLTF